jgi:transposase InsO family protein
VRSSKTPEPDSGTTSKSLLTLPSKSENVLTYVPMAHGFQYLMAIIDVGSRKTLSWRVSNTMTPDFCVEALKEALGKYGKPEIFNTDHDLSLESTAA